MTRCFLTLAATLAALALARADECMPLAEAQKKIEATGGGEFRVMTRDQLMFVRGLYVTTPPMSPYPAGDDAMISQFEGGGAVVLFVAGDKSCGQIGFGPLVAKLVLEIGHSI